MSINNTQSSVYNQMIQWRDVQTNGTAEEMEQVGLTFNFMDGKDSTNEKDYNEQIKTLGEGDLKLLDTDSDGSVSKSEYIARELYDLGENATDDEKAETMALSYLAFDAIDSQMGDKNSDGALGLKEFEEFYKSMDSFQCDLEALNNDEIKGESSPDYADGEFNAYDSAAYMMDLVNSNYTQDQQVELQEQFLKAIQENN